MRRRLVAVAAMATVAVLAGCSGGGSPEPSSGRDYGQVRAGEVQPGVLDGVELVYAGTGGDFQDGQVEAYWGPFAEESGAEMVQDALDPAKLKASVEAGDPVFDLAAAGQSEVVRLCESMYQPIDWDLVDTSDVVPEFLVSECGVPNILYGTVVAYNLDALGGKAPTSVADFFDTERFPGKRGVAMTPWFDNSILEMALLADGADLENLTDADVERAIDLFKGLGDDLVPWTSGVQSQQQLESGEVAMSIVWSGRGYSAAAAGAPVSALWDDWVVMVDYIGVPKDVADPEAAFAALNFMLGPEQQAQQLVHTTYSPVIQNPAEVEVDGVLGEWVVNDKLESGSISNYEFWAENWDSFTAQWADWVSGVN